MDDSSSDLVSFSSLDCSGVAPPASPRTTTFEECREEILAWVARATSELEAQFGDFKVPTPLRPRSEVTFDSHAPLDASAAPVSALDFSETDSEAPLDGPASPVSSYFSFPPYPEQNAASDADSDDVFTSEPASSSPPYTPASVRSGRSASPPSWTSPSKTASLGSSGAPSLPRTLSSSSSSQPRKRRSISSEFSEESIYMRAHPSTEVSTWVQPVALPSRTTTLRVLDLEFLEWDEYLVWPRRYPTRENYLLKKRTREAIETRWRRREAREAERRTCVP